MKSASRRKHVAPVLSVASSPWWQGCIIGHARGYALSHLATGALDFHAAACIIEVAAHVFHLAFAGAQNFFRWPTRAIALFRWYIILHPNRYILRIIELLGQGDRCDCNGKQ